MTELAHGDDAIELRMVQAVQKIQAEILLIALENMESN